MVGTKATQTQRRRAWARPKDEGLCPSNAQSKEGIKGREYEPKSPHVLHTTRDKHQSKRAAKSNKHGGSRNGVKAKKKQI